jgi:arylsulfatase A-like enzyme
MGASSARGEEASPVQRPNVVIIISDDLDYNSLSSTSYVDTPHIDSIIEAGTYFSNGYVSAAVCAPARAGLMMGRHQVRVGYQRTTGPIERQIEEDIGVDTREILLPQYLQEAGYVTGVIGKWHLGYNEKYRPNQRGVDYFFGFLAGAHDYYKWDTPETGVIGGSILRNNEKVDGEGYITEAFAQEAASFIHRNSKQPFFLYYSPLNVHKPEVVPKKYIPPGGMVKDGMVKALDDSVGVILAALKSAGVMEHTLLVFINDNGGKGNNAPFRGTKGEFFEGGIRVAFAMSWPGKIPARKIYAHPVTQLDILPTALAAAGVDLARDREYDGVNLLPYLAGQESGPPHEMLFWRSSKKNQAVRVGDLKLLLSGKRGVELYDLKRDRGEEHDLAADRPEDVKRLNDALTAWQARMAAEQYSLIPPPRN